MSAARHFHNRSPRYILQADDQNLMRFAGMETRGSAVRARVRDLSESGLAFAVAHTHPSQTEPTLPEEGDMLKVEFTVPDRGQIACFATVTRVETKSDWEPDLGARDYSLIACQFRHLPTLHARTLKLSLERRTQQESEFNWTWQKERRQHLFAFAGMSLALFLSLVVMITPIHSWVSTLRSIFS